jgi:hypothetical protein
MFGFDCTPKGELFGLPANGKRVSFTENVFYQFTSGKIEIVWSVIDQPAIKAVAAPCYLTWWKNVDPEDDSNQGLGNRLPR